MIDIDKTDISEVKRAIVYLKASHISGRIMNVLNDYYKDTDVEPLEELDLGENITNELMIILSEFE